MKNTDTARIKVTEEMIEAGLDALYDAKIVDELFEGSSLHPPAVRSIFLAMLDQSSNPHKTFGDDHKLMRNDQPSGPNRNQ